MQQDDASQTILKPTEDLVISLHNQDEYVNLGLFISVGRIADVNCYRLDCDIQVFRRYFPDALHYLDRFWLLLPATIQEQQTLWQEFYRLYSNIYDQLIDRGHNLACLQDFKRIIESRLPAFKQCRLLDFGCGTGLAADVFDSRQLVCYDSNEMMRHFALNRGLTIINTHQFRALPTCSFDVCIACYVFHMAVDERDIKQLARITKNGGIIAANFYKGMQEDRINHIIKKQGLLIEQLEGRQGKFGSIYIYQKL